jgi:hypothetical protein
MKAELDTAAAAADKFTNIYTTIQGEVRYHMFQLAK